MFCVLGYYVIMKAVNIFTIKIKVEQRNYNRISSENAVTSRHMPEQDQTQILGCFNLKSSQVYFTIRSKVRRQETAKRSYSHLGQLHLSAIFESYWHKLKLVMEPKKLKITLTK